MHAHGGGRRPGNEARCYGTCDFTHHQERLVSVVYGLLMQSKLHFLAALREGILAYIKTFVKEVSGSRPSLLLQKHTILYIHVHVPVGTMYVFLLVRILILVSMYRYMSCALSDWLTCRPEGCSQPRELWFSDILISLLFMSTVLFFFHP